jgi:hypothetical protein
MTGAEILMLVYYILLFALCGMVVYFVLRN